LNEELGLTPKAKVRLDALVEKHNERIKNRAHYGSIETILHRFRQNS